MLINAKDKIVEFVDKSENDKLLSEKNLQDAKVNMDTLSSEVEKINNDAAGTVEAYKNTVDADLKETEKKLDATSKKIIDNEVLRINTELQKELALSVVEKAHQQTLDRLNFDSNLHRKFIAEAIDKLEEIDIK